MNQAAVPDAWPRDLLESDRLYFEADAETIPIWGATIARLRGLEALAAGCVVQRIDAPGIESRANEWLVSVEERLRALHCPRARLYLHEPNPRLETALARRGYRPRVEFGLLRAAGSGEPKSIVYLRPADDERGWSARKRIVERCAMGPDEYEVDPDLWVAMERRKCGAGYMQPYLIVGEGAVVGAVSAATCGSVLRLKNLFVDPEYRRRGVATATAACFVRLAKEAGHPATGCFAIDGAPGVTVYALAGYDIVTRQTEWLRDIEGVPG